MKKLKSLKYYYGTSIVEWNSDKGFLYERYPALSAKYVEFGNSRRVGQFTLIHELFTDFASRGAYMDGVIKQRVKRTWE